MTKQEENLTDCSCGMAASGMAYGPMYLCPQHCDARGFARLVEEHHRMSLALRDIAERWDTRVVAELPAVVHRAIEGIYS